MTEDDAKTKWCPFARVAMFDGSSVMPIGNRMITAENLGEPPSSREMSPQAARCIGSACMAWRWDAKSSLEIGTPDKLVHDEKRGPQLVATAPERVEGYDWWRSDRRKEQLPGWTTWRCEAQDNGYCGLAGKP